MLLTSVLSFLVPGIISTAINYNRQQQQNLQRMQQIKTMTTPNSYPEENHDDEKKKFWGTIKALYPEAKLNDITTEGNCFYYDNPNNLTIFYNVKSPYLVIHTFVESEDLFPQEEFKKRILSCFQESKGIYINIEEKEYRIIQIAIPLSTANHTDSLKDVLFAVEEMVRQENSPVLMQTK